MSTSTPWGASQHVEHIAPGIRSVTTAGHGGILLSDGYVKRIPAEIDAGYSGNRNAWEEDADWAVPYLLFESDFANWECVKRMGADEVRKVARSTLANYRPDWLAAIDAQGSKQ